MDGVFLLPPWDVRKVPRVHVHVGYRTIVSKYLYAGGDPELHPRPPQLPFQNSRQNASSPERKSSRTTVQPRSVSTHSRSSDMPGSLTLARRRDEQAVDRLTRRMHWADASRCSHTRISRPSRRSKDVSAESQSLTSRSPLSWQIPR